MATFPLVASDRSTAAGTAIIQPPFASSSTTVPPSIMIVTHCVLMESIKEHLMFRSEVGQRQCTLKFQGHIHFSSGPTHTLSVPTSEPTSADSEISGIKQSHIHTTFNNTICNTQIMADTTEPHTEELRNMASPEEEEEEEEVREEEGGDRKKPKPLSAAQIDYAIKQFDWTNQKIDRAMGPGTGK